MISFLDSVAQAYSRQYSSLQDFCFVFPNKRSGTFFLKALSQQCDDYRFAPEVTTISDFTSDLAELIPDNKLNMLFKLFSVYRSLIEEGMTPVRETGSTSAIGKEDTEGYEFDLFRRWGETVINDFSEVDMHMIDIEELFKNVKDLKEISSNFLTPDQLKVMEDYFGYTSPAHEAASFWQTFDPVDFSAEEISSTQECEEDGERKPKSKRKFLHLWRVLAPLYERFKKVLEEDGLSTPGGVYRRAAEMLEKEEEPELIQNKKLVFVGFNALTRSERHIFRALRDRTVKLPGTDAEEPAADFLWDASGPLLNDVETPAARFININRKKDNFPPPEWIRKYLKMSEVTRLPESLEIVGVPSNSMQTRIIGKELAALLPTLPDKDIEEAKVAIVLPNEQMLQPMLFSLPDSIREINLTMGYPLKITPVASFVYLLRRMQLRQRTSRGERGFFAEDVKSLLGHPFSQVLFGTSRILKCMKEMQRMKKIIMTVKDLEIFGEDGKLVFSPLNLKESEPLKVLIYVDNVLAHVGNILEKSEGKYLKSNLECAHIAGYRGALVTLGECINAYGTKMSSSTVFILTDRLINGVLQQFEGEPLKGLQVMGMLETRSLDFDYLFIPSVNDKILPKRSRNRTFIPNTLRRAYGMPPANHQEALFAYYFFRLLSRAKKVFMTFDSRAGNNKGGGMSRYLLQMLHLSAPDSINLREAKFVLKPQKDYAFPVAKDDQVMELMRLFTLPPSKDKDNTGLKVRNFSPSAVTCYNQCGLKFYYKYVLRIPELPTELETISALHYGDIVHNVMMELYAPDKEHQQRLLDHPILLEAKTIRAIREQEEFIRRKINRTINRIHFNITDETKLDRVLTGSAVHVAPLIEKNIHSILEWDEQCAPITLLGVEIKERLRYPLSDGREVNVNLAIDRLDIVDGKVRIVDYKTGSVHLEAESAESIFSDDYKAQNILQLYFYETVLEYLNRLGKFPLPVDPATEGIVLQIYDIPKIHLWGKGKGGKKSNPSSGMPKIEGKTQENQLEYAPIFRQALDSRLIEILNPEIDFIPTPDRRNCANCDYNNFCHR